jgi:hypothetical protein
MLVNLPLVVDSTVKKLVIDFVNNSKSNFWINNTAGNTFNRKYCTLNKHDLPISKIIRDYSKLVFLELNISQQIEEERFGNLIGCNAEGGFVHPHTDQPSSKGWQHVRINFLISKPYQGGNPVIENKEYNIMEDNAWFNLASKWVHSSTPVVGDKARVVLSLGAFVSSEELNEAKIY